MTIDIMSFGNCNWKLAAKLIILGAVLSTTNAAKAQEVVPDNTLPNNSVVDNLPNGITEITGGTQAGGNLFHSFEKFGVPTGGEVNFQNAVDINNIINRVTGGNISNIDGLIKANGSANLFLINPAGIVFGPNARLDIGGSFIGSTADALGFGEDNFFSATDPQNSSSLLSINPNALFFNRINGTAPIENNSLAESGSRNLNENFTARGLRVDDGKSLLLVGGDININGGDSFGGLYAFGGRVELGGLRGVGTVGLNSDGNNFSLSFPDGVEKSNVTLSNLAEVNVRAGDGGSIAVNAGNLEMSGESFLLAGIDTGLGDDGSKAGNIDINVSDAILLNDGSGIRNNVRSQANGQGGDVNINTNTLSVQNGALVSAGTSSNSKGNAGDLIIKTNSLLVKDGGFVNASTRGTGKGGNLTVEAGDITLTRGEAGVTGLFTQANSGSTGDGGDLTINTNSLRVENGAVVSASTFAQGKGGNLTIDAQEKVEVIGESSNGVDSGLFAQANNGSTGNAGNLKLKTNSLLVQNGAEVSASTFGEGKGGNLTVDAQDIQLIGTSADGRFGSGLFANARENSTGDAGDLTVKTNTLRVENGAGVNVSTSGAGKGGNLIVDAQDIQLIGTSADGRFASGLSASARESSTGDAGDLSVNTNSLLVENGAEVSAATFGGGNGGNITVDAQDIQLIGTTADGDFVSGLFASAQENSTGDSGNLIVNTNRLFLEGGAQLFTGTFGEGRGGNLTVNAQDIQLIGESSKGRDSGLFASAQSNSKGNAGNLIVNTNTLLVRDGAEVAADTRGEGKGGNLTVDAQSIELIRGGGDSTGLFARARSNSTGDAGNLRINTNSLLVRDGAQVSASTFAQGKGGNLTIDAQDIQLIGRSADDRFASGLFANAGTNSTGDAGDLRINTNSLLVRDGAEVSAATSGAGNGGNLTVDAQDIQLIGTSADGRFGSGLFAQADLNSPNAGDLTVKTNTLLVKDDAQVTVESLGTGNAGDLNINAADSITLNQGTLSAESETGVGGNINLDINELLLLRNNSLISAISRERGTDGNITINTGFIVAVPSENSDIVAFGEGRTPSSDIVGFDQGLKSGSNIGVFAQGILGIEFRTQRTPESDIVATGDVTLNIEESEPEINSIELPEIPLESRFNDLCEASTGPNPSEFYIIGNGGVPLSPWDYLEDESIYVDWVPIPKVTRGQGDKVTRRQGDKVTRGRVVTQNRIVEATGWIVDKNGDIYFVADASHGTPPPFNNPSCLKNRS